MHELHKPHQIKPVSAHETIKEQVLAVGGRTNSRLSRQRLQGVQCQKTIGIWSLKNVVGLQPSRLSHDQSNM